MVELGITSLSLLYRARRWLVARASLVMEQAWAPPDYKTSHAPSLKSTLHPAHFARTAKWCPDGSTILVHCEDHSLQLFTHPNGPPSPQIFPQPSPVLEFLWYPTASPRDPASYCFLASVRDRPLKLLDASDGRLRASYPIVDHRERHVAPHSLAFDLFASRLYCGFLDAIEVFDVSRPGPGTRLPTTPSRKSKDGLKGIISALAFAPSYDSDLYAAGSLSPTPSNIALFTSTQSEPVMFVSGTPRAGVTQIQFNPVAPHLMYTAHRRHGTIYAWDLRTHLDAPFATYDLAHDASRARTNQKIKFDIDLGGRWLASGDHRGSISIFDLHDPEAFSPTSSSSSTTKHTSPVLEFSAHDDAIGSVAFHPLHPSLLSVSGSRHFLSPDSSESESDADSDARIEASKARVVRRMYPTSMDRSIKTWSFA